VAGADRQQDGQQQQQHALSRRQRASTRLLTRVCFLLFAEQSLIGTPHVIDSTALYHFRHMIALQTVYSMRLLHTTCSGSTLALQWWQQSYSIQLVHQLRHAVCLSRAG
jgi:hypothetical protein